jgi:hypothetical protein
MRGYETKIAGFMKVFPTWLVRDAFKAKGLLDVIDIL